MSVERPESALPPRGSWGKASLGALRILLVSVLVIGCAAWAMLSTWRSLEAAWAELGADIVLALWTLGLTIPLHLVQLLISAAAWSNLLPGVAPPWPTLLRLRIVREAIDSLLPVAQVGGEVVGAGLLAGRGVSPAIARASVIVDVTVELLTQILFLLAGLLGLAAWGDQAAWGNWAGAALAASVAAILLVLAQRFGALRLMEGLIRRIAARVPHFSGASLAGLEAAARDMYCRPLALARAAAWHLLAWMAGTGETWLVLHALGQPVGLAQAFVIESLGMAARSAGFAVPGALGVQEGGFMLAAAAFGIPQGPALALSLVKRLREVLIGLLGLILWRWPVTAGAK